MIPLNSVSEILIQVKPLAGARRALSSELGHEPADRRVGAGEPPLLDEPIVDALGGVPLLARGGEVLASTFSIQGPLPSRPGRALALLTGATGDMSSMSAYLLTVLRLTWSLRAISDLETPSASIDRISFLMSRGTVISSILPGRSRQSTRPGKHTARAAPPVPGARPS